MRTGWINCASWRAEASVKASSSAATAPGSPRRARMVPSCARTMHRFISATPGSVQDRREIGDRIVPSTQPHRGPGPTREQAIPAKSKLVGFGDGDADRSNTGMASAAGPVSIRVSPRLKLARDLVEEIGRAWRDRALRAVRRYRRRCRRRPPSPRHTCPWPRPRFPRARTRRPGRAPVAHSRLRPRTLPTTTGARPRRSGSARARAKDPIGSKRLIARSSTRRASSGRPTDRYGADNQSSHSLNAVSSPDSASNACSSSPAAIASRSCSTRSQLCAELPAGAYEASTGMSSA